jgi:hypothetical protein
MEAVETSETLVNLYQSARRYNPGDSHLQVKNLLHKPSRKAKLKFQHKTFYTTADYLVD